MSLTGWDNAVKLVKQKSEKGARAIALQLFAAIIKDTPVDTGRLRGNWQTTIAQPASGSFPNSKDKNGTVAGAAMKEKVTQWKLNTSIFLTNNLPYAKAIEGGHSTQRPYGMVKTNVRLFQAFARRAARNAKS